MKLFIFLNILGTVIDSNGKYGTGDQPIVYSHVDCFGHEQSLSKCSKLINPNFTCYYNNYIIGLLCLDSKFIHFVIVISQLVNTY